MMSTLHMLNQLPLKIQSYLDEKNEKIMQVN